MLGYCKKCQGAVFLESVGSGEKRAEITCIHCGIRKFVPYELVKKIINYHNRRARYV